MNTIKERPILFSAPMVRAILEGRKTVTRRAVNPQPVLTEGSGFSWKGHLFGSGSDDRETSRNFSRHCCPFGQPGDRLWVRETFAVESNRYADEPYSAPHKDGRPIKRYEDEKWDQPHYRATDPEPELWYDDKDGPGCRWKPSIHMPRWVSRVLLEITDIRVERLQDINRSDIRAEGLQCPPELASDDVTPNYRDWYPAAWRELWESTGGNWDANHWVWVVEFKQVTP